MNGLDLFSGIGGIGLALSPWVRTVAYCEKDRYAQGVLLSRMRSGDIDRAPIWDDITTLHARLLPKIDIIFGGFPCQDISVAGRGAGLAGERSGLFFEIARLVEEVAPQFVFLENVPALRTRGGETVVKTLASLRYDCRWTTLSAASIGAPHRRERWFLLAYSCSNRYRIANKQGGISGEDRQRAPHPRSNGPIKSLANINGEGSQRQQQKPSGTTKKLENSCDTSWWSVEPSVGRVVNGLSNRVDRIRCLGNSVVPLQARKAFEKLIGANRDDHEDGLA